MRFISLIGCLTFTSLLNLPVYPASAAYSLEASTFSAGGGESISATYSNLGVIGQPGIVGSSNSGAYTARHGFLSVLGDGFKILYPVIAVTPGTLTFSLISGANGNLPLDISNSGGSTLNWSVVKSTADDIFTLSSANGTNSGSVTVTANAASLASGTYSNTLTISGEGISQTVLVQLDLTVSQQLYTLAVTLKQTTPGKGGGNITMAVLPAPAAKSCSHLDASCSYDFPANSTVTLSQFPDSNTQRGTWGAPGCGSNPTCQIVLNAPQGTDITFPYSSMAMVSTTGTGFESLALAYGGAAAADTIKARAVTFPVGDLLLDSGKTITLLGGLDAYYTAQSGQFSTLSGRLTVGKGALTVDKLIIK